MLLQTGDGPLSQQMTLSVLQLSRDQQALSLSYCDIFWASAALAICLVFLVLLMRRAFAEKRGAYRGGVKILSHLITWGYNSVMGATHATIAVIKPGNPQHRWEALFLVDTGAIDCMAPATHLRSIGILPRSKRTYELADGSEISFDVGTA